MIQAQVITVPWTDYWYDRIKSLTYCMRAQNVLKIICFVGLVKKKIEPISYHFRTKKNKKTLLFAWQAIHNQ